MSDPPLVSVVIPCFNQAHYLRGALESVRAQTWRAIESIVVDDGSTDTTSEVARLHCATIVLRQENSGLSAARNAGLAAAHGEYVLFLDADDELLPDAVRTGVETLQRERHAGVVGRYCRLMDGDGRPLPVTHSGPCTNDLYAELLARNFVWTPGAAFFRRDAIQQIGGFPLEHAATADYAVLLALARRRQLIVEPREVIWYRKHERSMSADPMLMLRAALGTLERERRQIPREYVRALAKGRRCWQEFYSDQLTMLLRREWRTSRRPAMLVNGVLFLCRYCPRQAARHFLRKLLRVVRSMPSGDLEPPFSATPTEPV